MEAIFTSSTKKEKVAAAIREQIRSNRTAAGTRLDSVRNLAKSFGVSIKVIVDALDILESKRLITREAGRGVFVRGADNRPLEIAILGIGGGLEQNAYFRHLALMSAPPALRKGFNFMVRTVSVLENDNDQLFMEELSRFERLANADCLLLNTPLSNKQRVEFCLKLNTPVLFIGDFSEGDYSDLHYHQLAGDPVTHGRLAVQAVLKRESTSEMALFIGSSERFFYREYITGVKTETQARGVTLSVVEMPKGASSMTEPLRQATYLKHFKAAYTKGALKGPALSVGLRDDLTRETLGHLGATPSAIYQASEGKSDWKRFHNAVYSKIKAVLAEPQYFEKTIYSPKTLHLRKLSRG